MKKLGILILDLLAVSTLVYIFLFLFDESHNLDRISENRRIAARVITWSYCISIALYFFLLHSRSFAIGILAGILAFYSLGVAIMRGLVPFIVYMIVMIIVINLLEHLINRFKKWNRFLMASFEVKKAPFESINPTILEVELSHEKLENLVGQSFAMGQGKGEFKILNTFKQEDDHLLVAGSWWEKVLLLFDVQTNSVRFCSLTGIVDYHIQKSLQMGIERRIRILD